MTSDQAAASNLSAFDVKSGFHQASVTVLGGVDIDVNWSLTGVISYREALGDYRDSPIMTAPDGSASGLFATLGITRRYNLN
ncbi:MipA/OmpV family protein [Litorimonas sp. WD9-15]|uniref:MipA/OmpV family protein n=1 Tax=Litorimonas sp. WD9-15 TaxID=3418716 RepID=UPI003CFF475E